MRIEKTAIILAGGKSSRMNYNNKAFLKMGDRTLIEILLARVSSFQEIIIVSNSPSDYNHLGVKVVTDIIPNFGPLSGVHSGLVHSKYQYSLVLPCDMPFISSETIEHLSYLAEGFDIVVPKLNDGFQPLCSIYSKSCVGLIEKNIGKYVLKLTDLYSIVRVRTVEEEELARHAQTGIVFRNINSVEEYNKYCYIEKEYLNINEMILIGSTGQNSGKTTLATMLIEKWKDKFSIVALKITTVHSSDGKCPRGGPGCGACTKLSGNFELIEETNTNMKKDTSLLLAAGAQKVYWLRCFSTCLREGIDYFKRQITKDSIIICESNSLRKVVKPGCFVILKNSRSDNIKSSAAAMMHNADIIVENNFNDTIKKFGDRICIEKVGSKVSIEIPQIYAKSDK